MAGWGWGKEKCQNSDAVTIWVKHVTGLLNVSNSADRSVQCVHVKNNNFKIHKEEILKISVFNGQDSPSAL